MKKLALIIAFLIGSVGSAAAICAGPAVMHDFPGGTFNMSLATNAGDGNCASNIGIIGTLPPFAAPPTVNLGTIGGAATAANQATAQTSLGTIATNSGTQATAAGQATGNASLATIATNSAAQATAANQATANTSLGTIATNSATQATAANQTIIHNDLVTLNATAGGPVPAGTNNIGKFDIDAASPGLNPLGPAAVSNSVPHINSSQYPANNVTTTPTPLGAHGAGSTAAVTGTLTPASTATAYVCGFSFSAIGGTANPGPLVLSGVLGGPFTYQLAPNSATIGQNFFQPFSPCLPASAVNTPIVVTTTAAAGATATDVNMWGYGL